MIFKYILIYCNILYHFKLYFIIMFYYIVLNVVILFAIHYKHDIIVVYNKCNYMKQY